MSPECSSTATSAGKEWEEYIVIRGLVEKIRKKQKGESINTIFPFQISNVYHNISNLYHRIIKW